MILRILAGVLVGLGLQSTVLKAQPYPNRNVSFLIPFAAGGGTDVLARMMAQRLSDKLGKPLIPENRAGAGTVIAATALANSPPDGYTLMMGTSSTLVINPALYKKLPYDPKKLAPVSLIARVPFVLVVNPSLPVHNVAELVAYAKARPDALNYGSVGQGSLQHLATEALKRELSINMVHVPYKGGPQLLSDVLGGNIQATFIDIASGAGDLIRTGKLRAIGLSSVERLVSDPDIVPLAEQGMPNFNIAAWQMVMAPTGTPPEVISALNTTLNEIVSDRDVSKQIVSIGYVPIGKNNPEELSKFVEAETGAWAKLVAAAGLTGSE